MNSAYDQHVLNFTKGFLPAPGAGKPSGHEDPTYLGFKLEFDFHPHHRSSEDMITHDALFADEDQLGLDSAMRHLRDRGYGRKADMLKAFRGGLEYLTQHAPYYLQAVSGTRDLWTRAKEGEKFDPFRGKEKVLTVTCLESIDMRITAMADLYRQATFDEHCMRWLLPENLRIFSVNLIIAEMRSFHRVKQIVEASAGGSNKDYPDLELVPNLVSLIKFKLGHCQFDFEESFPEEIKVDGEMIAMAQKFKIRVGTIHMDNNYSVLGMRIKTSEGLRDQSELSGAPFNGQRDAEPSLTSRQRDMSLSFSKQSKYSPENPAITAARGTLSGLERELEVLLPNLVNRGVNAVQSKLNGLVLGNVYDRPQTLRQVGAAIAEGFNSLVGNGQQVASVGGAVSSLSPMGFTVPEAPKLEQVDLLPDSPPVKTPNFQNVFPDTIPPATAPTGENVYPGPPPDAPPPPTDDVYPEVPGPITDGDGDQGNVYTG